MSNDDVATEPFERAKLALVLAGVGVACGLAIASSVERTAGGIIVLAAWVLGIAALHHLGRAGAAGRRHANVTEGPSSTPSMNADPPSSARE